MLNRIIAFSIKNKFIIAMMTFTLMIWGVWSARQLPIDALPDITNNQVQIITICPKLAGQEVEQLVTYPIEQSINNLPDIVELRSISRFGLSVITVVFEEEVDIYFARQLIHEKLKSAKKQIPAGMGTPELGPVSTGLGEIYQYIIHPQKGSEDKYSAMDLRTMQDWIVARQLIGTPGVAEVNSFGGELKQYEVAVNPEQLLAMGVSISDIFTALEKNNENTGGAYIDKKPSAYFIRSIGLISSFEDIEKIVVKSNPNGIPILIKDLAEVRFGSALRYGAVSYNGQVDAVGGMVMMLKGANSAEVVKLVKEKMVTIQQSLPEDVIVEAFLDRTNLVNRAIATVKKNLIEGALIVIFVLVVFLGNFRAGLIVASAIPLALLFALGMMNVFGVSANLMSLGAIDFGLIVDGAVIIVEATLHHLGLRRGMKALTQDEMDEEVFQSASKIRSSAAFGEIIILIVYLPILSLVGIEGKMFGPMAMTVGFAIFGALILSLTYIPMMCALFLPKQYEDKKNFSDKLIDAIYSIYEPLLEKALAFKKSIILFTVALFVACLFLFSRMGGEFIPTLQEGDFAFHCILPQGTSLSQSLETSMQAARIIKQFDEVKMVVNKTGSAEIPSDPMPPEATDMMIILNDMDSWKRDVSYDDLAQEILDALEVIPGVFFETNQPIQMRFNELMTGVRQDVAIKIFGENMDTLAAYAKQVSSVIQTVEGASEPMAERVEGLPQIVIEYNRSQIANYGLNLQDVNQVISASFAGGDAGVVFENERKFDLVVRLNQAYRKDIDDVAHLYIPTPNGQQIPLSQIAEVKMELGPAQISREDGKRRIVIGFNAVDRDVSSIVEEIQEKLKTSIKLPLGYYFTYGGTFENLQAASKRLMIAVPLALGLIFILLFFTFNSVKQALLIFTAIPMSAIGGILALLLRGMPFSISAGIGFIALFGVAVLNGIVLIGTFNKLEKDGMQDALARVIEGTKIRLRPVLMTAAVASLGFLPMALSSSAGVEVQKPLATVVIGGLLSATFLTLFGLPLLYLTFSNTTLMKTSKHFTLLLLLILPAFGIAQSANLYTLEELHSRAKAANLQLKSSQLNIEAASTLKKAAFELPETSVHFQYGQFNTVAMDNSINISQGIPFPTVMSSKKKWYEAIHEESKLLNLLSTKEVLFQVSALFYEIQFLNNKGLLLEENQLLFEKFVQAANLRFQSGETNILEKTSAGAKLGQVNLEINDNERAVSAAYLYLKNLLNIKDDFSIPIEDRYEPIPSFFGVANSIKLNHPKLALNQQQLTLKEREQKMERALLMPDFSIGYFNQSIQGFQNVSGTEVYYSRSKRFQGFNVGLTLPITAFSNGAKIKAMGFEKEALALDAENEALSLQAQLDELLLMQEQLKQEYKYYTSIALINANIITEVANTSLKSGAIHFLEYLQAIQQSSEIQMGYLETINNINQNSIQINYLTK